MIELKLARISLVDGERRENPVEIGQAALRGGTLYVLAEVSAPTEAWDDACQQIIEKAISAFRSSKQSETSALQAAAHSVNAYLLDKNKALPRSEHIWAGMNLAFIKDEDLYLAQAGPALTYIARGDSVTRFPKSFSELQTNRMEALTPLGERLEIRCRLAHFQLQPDDQITLAASHLPTMGAESRVADAVRGASAEEVVAALHGIARNNDFSALTIQYSGVPPLAATPASAPQAAPAASEMDEWDEEEEVEDEPDVWDEEELDEDDELEDDGWEDVLDVEPVPPPAPPVREPEPRPVMVEPAARQEPPRRAPEPPPEPEPELEPVIVKKPPRRAETPREVEPTPVAATPPPISRPSRSATPPPEGVVENPTPRPTSNGATRPSAKQVVAPAPVMSRAELFEDDDTGGEAQARPGVDWQAIARKAGDWVLGAIVALLGAAAAFLAWLQRAIAPRLAASGPVWDRIAHAWRRLMYYGWYIMARVGRQVLPGDRTAPPPRHDAVPPPPGDGSGFLKLAVFILPLLVIVAAVTVGALWGGGSEAAAESVQVSEYQSLLVRARELLFQAQSVDETTAQTLVGQANQLLDQAEPLEPTQGTPGQVAALRQEAQNLMNQAGTAAGTSVTLLAALASDMEALSLVEGGGSLFALEGSRDSVYRVLVNPQSPVALVDIAPLLTAQQRLSDGAVAGTPQRIVWVPAGSGRQNNGLLVLTEQSLFDYDPASNAIRSLPFSVVQGEIRDAEGYGGNLYLLDRANRQVWKYVPDGAGQYSTPPVPWMNEAGQGQMGAPIDMAVDGYIYLLDESGEITRFQVGERKSGFALDPVNPPLSAPVAMAKVPPETTDIFVADAQRVLRFDQNGRFLTEYRPPMSGGTIRDIAVDEKNETLYILTTTGIYMIDVRATAPVQASPPPAQPTP
ncbi:MAG TPA: hypothetical protein VF707_12485 [Ardenticatenaceae bacterium]